MSGPPICADGSFGAEIRRHFAGSISVETERALRHHLADCAKCRDEYERYLVLGELDPKALSAEERIGRGLGLRPRAEGVGFPLLAVGLTSLCAAAVALAVPFGSGEKSLGVEDREFAARGPERTSDEFVVYRVRAGAPPERAPRRMRRDDELAFAYTNPSGFSYLLVFGVDARNAVHWYHPGWTDADATPRAVGITKGAELHELPEAVAQKLEGSTLRLYAVFTNEALDVREVEGSLASDKPGHPSLALSGVLVREWLVEVE